MPAEPTLAPPDHWDGFDDDLDPVGSGSDDDGDVDGDELNGDFGVYEPPESLKGHHWHRRVIGDLVGTV